MQVSNWFINARVRLWKPMVEEMYAEEMKNQEDDNSESNKDQMGSSKSTAPKDNKTEKLNAIIQDEISNSSHHVTLSPNGCSQQQARAGFGLVCALNMEGNAEKTPKKVRTHHELQNSPSSILSMDMEMKFGETRKGFGAFNLGDLGQFNPEQLTTGFHGNGVSLTLGLPPSENLPLSARGSHQNFVSEQTMDLGNRMEMGTIEAHYDRIVNKPQASHGNNNMAYDQTINDFENRKRFAAQLLPDFVT